MIRCITGTRIIGLSKLKGFDLGRVQFGVPVKNDEAKRVGLKKVGDIVLPSASFGPVSHRNAYGYSYSDKSKPKERRTVTTLWMHPYGNENASEIAVDINRMCYPIVEMPPYGIELCLYENHESGQLVIIYMTDGIREKYLKEAVNLLLEIYGICYVYDGEFTADEMVVSRRRCNWEILPPGEMPSRHIERYLSKNGENKDTFDVHRLKHIEKYPAKEIVEGINGFGGYYAFVYEEHCVLESALYGNATYIIPYENWEVLSQKTKQELFDEHAVEKRIVHTANWKHEIERTFRRLGIQHTGLDTEAGSNHKK